MEEIVELNQSDFCNNNGNNSNKNNSSVINNNNNNILPDQLPYYSGEKGWVSPAWVPPTPKMSFKQPYSAEGGWVSEQWDSEKRPTGSNKEAAQHNPHPKYHTGKKGWVAPNWEESFSGSPFKPDHIIKSSANHPYQVPAWTPLTSVANGPNTIVVEIELAGVRKEDIFIEILQQESTSVPLFDNEEQSSAIVLPSSQLTTSYLFVKGVKHNRWHNSKIFDERNFGYFEKSIYIGTNINRESPILATFTDGVLTVCIHKPLAINK